jgi:hypothetical protein
MRMNPRSLANLDSHKFKPGQSGNPGGRPKSEHISKALKRLLAAGDTDRIAKALIRLAKKGNVSAAREIADRTEGKPRQAHDVTLDQDLGDPAERLRELLGLTDTGGADAQGDQLLRN